MLLDPAGVSSDPRLLRSPTVAFQIFDPVGLRMYHEAQSLHLHYGLDIALSTLNSCRYLHEPKTRFPVGRLFPFPGRELHPLKAPGLSWRTEAALDISFDDPLVGCPLASAIFCRRSRTHAHSDMLQGAMAASSGTKPVRHMPEASVDDRLQDILDRAFNYAITHGRDTEGSELPWLTRLGDQLPS